MKSEREDIRDREQARLDAIREAIKKTRINAKIRRSI